MLSETLYPEFEEQNVSSGNKTPIKLYSANGIQIPRESVTMDESKLKKIENELIDYQSESMESPIDLERIDELKVKSGFSPKINNEIGELMTNLNLKNRDLMSQKKYKHTLKRYNERKKQRIIRQIIITSLGFILFTFGFLVLISVYLFLDKAINDCNNPNNDFLSKHPELNFYNFCNRKVYPFFPNKQQISKCQCRRFIIDTSNNNFNFNKKSFNIKLWNENKVLEHIFINFGMLEELWINYNSIVNFNSSNYNLNIKLNLTERKYFGAKRLRILYLNEVSNVYFGNKIDLWEELQVLYLNPTHFMDSFNVNKLGNLKELRILRLQNGFNVKLNNNTLFLCKLINLRDLDLSRSNINFIPNCINNLKKLSRIDLHFINNLNEIPIELFELINENLDTIIGYWNNFNPLLFPKLDLNTINFNNLMSLYLQSMDNRIGLCNNITLLNSDSQFLINKFKSCDIKCPLNPYECHSMLYKNGHCNEECNIKQCNFDSLDCNFNCLEYCDSNLLGNNICDIQCNTTDCSYDFGDCLINNITNETSIICGNSFYLLNTQFYDPLLLNDSNLNLNIYNSRVNGTCMDEWINDKWCDALCNNNNNCNNELLNDCNTCNGFCYNSWNLIINKIASMNKPLELISLNEFCKNRHYFDLFSQNYYNLWNCNDLFNIFDLNLNGYVSFWETIYVGRNYWGIQSQTKAFQIDCSLCLQNYTLYY